MKTIWTKRLANREGFIERLKKAWTALVGNEREAERENRPCANNSNWNSVVGALQDIRNDNQVAAAQQQAEWDRSAKRYWRRFWLDFAAIFVAAGGVIFLWRQQVTMQRQLNEMQAEQRPWVYAVEVEPAGHVILANDQYAIPIKFSIKNTGHLPAFFVVPKAGAAVLAIGAKTTSISNEICDGLPA